MALSREFVHEIANAVTDALGERIAGVRFASVAHGGTGMSCRLTVGERDYFLKTSSAARLSVFEAEMAALQEIASTKTVRVPLAICAGVADSKSFLVLEWLKLRPLTEESASHFGRLLAALHRHVGPQFGWYRNNTIGLTPQINGLMSNWFEFWKERRLRFQLELAASNGYTGRLQDLGAQLIECCGVLFSGYSPEPSLLHGDLWHGNAASSMSGEPVTFDPASYYGDREADLAMTSLFGGFPNTFMASYEATWPLNDGYAIRKDFYNIYHLINHLNLFGSGYLTQTEMTMQRVLAHITT